MSDESEAAKLLQYQPKESITNMTQLNSLKESTINGEKDEPMPEIKRKDSLEITRRKSGDE